MEQHTPRHRRQDDEQTVPSPRTPEPPEAVATHRRDMGPTLTERLSKVIS